MRGDCHLGTTFQIYLIQISTSELNPILSQIPGNRFCGKTLGRALRVCLRVSVYLKATPCQNPSRSMEKMLSTVQRIFAASHAILVALLP